MENPVLIFFIFLPFLAAFIIPLLNLFWDQAKTIVLLLVCFVLFLLSVNIVINPPQLTLYTPGGMCTCGHSCPEPYMKELSRISY